MAEKEERISVELLKDDFCASCDNRGKLKNCCCYEKQEYDERYQKSLPRQEAIEKMAKAICRRENLLDSCSHCMFYYKKQNGEMCKEILTKREDDMEASYIDIAEAALNALLDTDMPKDNKNQN